MKHVYFRWMEAWWSTTPERWAQLQHAADNFKPFSLDPPLVKELKSRPKGKIHTLKENR